ncbi:MAG: hypothetical protein K2Y04_12540 [Caulobacteraceae bacterium]|nr:hypothetical protein [Caulobacteraceae bacterium]
MPFCRRDTPDPLLRHLYDVHHLHLIPVVVGTAVGDLILVKPGGETWPVSLADLFEDAPDLTRQRDAAAADVENLLSGKFEADGVLGVLHALVAAMGVPGAGDLAAAYGSARTLRVRARGVTVDKIDLGAGGRFILDAVMRRDQGVYTPHDEIYMIREVFRGREIEVQAFDANDQVLKITAEATGLADARLNLRARNDNASTVVYAGAHPAAFAVRLVKIVQDASGWLIEGVTQPVGVRGDVAVDEAVSAPDAFIGNRADGPLFLSWPAPKA